MKKCPFCAEEIQDDAIKCRFCGETIVGPEVEWKRFQMAYDQMSPEQRKSALNQLNPEQRQYFERLHVGAGNLSANMPTARTASASAEKKVAMGCLGLLILGGLFAYCAREFGTPTNRATTQSPAESQAVSQTQLAVPKLALLSSRGYEEYGYHIIEGQVQNISTETLKSVTAIGTWFAKDGSFIKADDALIDFNPILPGQTSHFRTMSTSNPAMSRYSIDFKELMGGTILFQDQRNEPKKPKKRKDFVLPTGPG